MPRKDTKAARIMELYAQGLTTREIADSVGCLPEYVRVVARQRKGRGQSEIDRRYNYSEAGQRSKDRQNEKRREAYNSVPAEIRTKIRKRTYRVARERGLPPNRARNLAYEAVLRVAQEVAHA